MDKNYSQSKMHKRRKRRKRSKMDVKGLAETEFNQAAFEKRLQALKDSQESINNCCHWCLENRVHHKKIVSSWLNVLKRVKVEQRVTLFYLANDVIQYSKRKNYEFVESWGTTLQKATTMVRDERVKHKVLRIFKIWEQRGIYNEEFIADLSGLISATTTKRSDDPHEFQASYLVNKIKHCTNLENDTDAKLKKLKEHNPKIQIEKAENLCASLKDRAHVDDVEKEIDEYAAHIEEYVNALKAEIRARTNLISLLVQADTQLESDRRDVKLVASAYKTFGTRVKNVKKKLDEILPTLSSPIPSPDINAPSPSPDSDLELPESNELSAVTSSKPTSAAVSVPLPTQVQSAGYYNQLPITSSESSSFSSFMGSNMSFNLQNFSFNTPNTTGSIISNATTQTTNSYNLNNSLTSFFQSLVQPPPPPESVPTPLTTTVQAVGYQGIIAPPTVAIPTPPPPPQITNDYQYGSDHVPLLPPPMPPFSKDSGGYGNGAYCTDVYSTATAPSTGYGAETTSTYNTTDYQTPFDNPPPPPYNAASVTQYQPSVANTSYNSNTSTTTDAFSTDTIDQWNNWDTIDTPESPPTFEKQSYSEPIEYHDNVVNHGGGDVDHRILRHLPTVHTDTLIGHNSRGKDVDHRNLISLTGSPAETVSKEESNNGWSAQKDKDYRISNTADQDYRMSSQFDIEQLKLPPPPPPQVPSKTAKPGLSPRKSQDNVESIDMDLSDDDIQQQTVSENIKVLVDPTKNSDLMPPPPPPFPDLPDDVDANNLLDDLNNDLNSGEFNEALGEDIFQGNAPWMSQQDNSWMEVPPHHHQQQQYQDYENNFRGRGNVKRGGNWGHRGGRGRGFSPFRPNRGQRSNRGWGRSGFRGNYRGGY